jgi:multidrug resistance efflux pump
MHRRARLWSVLLALMALAACDSGPSREEFVEEANGICEDAENSLQELSGEALTQEDPSEIIDVASEELSNLRDELGELDRPDELSDDFDSMIEGLDGAIENIDSLSAAVDEAQSAGAEEVAEKTLREVQETSQSLTANLEQAGQSARAMGIDGCSEATGAGGS